MFLATLLFLADTGGAARPPQTSPVQTGSDIPAEWHDPSAARNFVRREVMIPIRDGVRLHTILLIPQRAAGAPMILDRTPYDAASFVSGNGPRLRDRLIPGDRLWADAGYILVSQDVRGKYGSEGDYVMTRPPIDPLNPTATDDTTEAYDTIDWLVKPVPFEPLPVNMGDRATWSTWLVGDQRFASTRSDVLSYQTPVLDRAIRLAGAPMADLFVKTTGTDTDLVVKIIDVYPATDAERPDLAGYQLPISLDIFRGRYRRGFASATPIPTGVVQEYRFRLPTLNYTVKPGHRIMVQVQSTLFPVYDRNPQTFVPNIFFARARDYRTATITVQHGGTKASAVLLPACRLQNGQRPETIPGRHHDNATTPELSERAKRWCSGARSTGLNRTSARLAFQCRLIGPAFGDDEPIRVIPSAAHVQVRFHGLFRVRCTIGRSFGRMVSTATGWKAKRRVTMIAVISFPRTSLSWSTARHR